MEITCKEDVRQNLIDAGCDSETIASFFKISGPDTRKEQLKLLDRHRKKLLEGIHRGQREIDCLDYLVMQIEKECRRESK